QAKELIESKALDGLDEGAQRSGKAYDTIKDGVGQFGEKSGEAAEAIADLESKLSKIDELQNMSGDQAGDLIREFGDLLTGLTDKLGPLIDVVPGLGSLLEFYAQAVQGISKSVDSMISVMRERNLIARKAGLDDVYVFTTGADTKRSKRIQEIEDELDDIGWPDAEVAPKTPTAEERRQAVDVANAVANGLRDCGCGAGASSDWAGWRRRRDRVRKARARLYQAMKAAEGSQHLGGRLDELSQRAAEAEATYEAAKDRAVEATANKAAEATAGHSSGSKIIDAVDEEKAARAAESDAESEAIKTKMPLDRYDRVRAELDAAEKEFDEAMEEAMACFRLMLAAMPDGEFFEGSEKMLTEQFSPAGSWDPWLKRKTKELLDKMPERTAVPRSARPAAGGPQQKPKDQMAATASRMSPMLLMMLVIGALMTALIGGLFVLGDDDPEETADEVIDAADDTEVIDDDGPAEDEATVVDETEAAETVIDDTEAVADEVIEEAEEVEVETPEDRIERLVDGWTGDYEDLITRLVREGWTDDEIDDHIEEMERDDDDDEYYSDEDEEAGNPGDDVDVSASDISRAIVDAAQALALFGNTIYECGVTVDGHTTVCDSIFDVTPFSEGEVVIATMVFADDVASGPWTYTYSAVFDSNGDPADDWVPIDPFNWDQYQGTDRWYVLDVVDGEFSLGRFDGSFGFPVPTGARVVVSGNVIRFFIPGSELGPEATGGRVTSFRHDGTFAPAASAGDSNGANPTEPLMSIDPIDVTFTTEG
ncbi:MAG: hypothetical protein AAGE98_12910, partial [Actinomycetota bacterium]